MKNREILTLVFGIILMIVGMLQILSSLYSSGILMFIAGAMIMAMRKEIIKLTKKNQR